MDLSLDSKHVAGMASRLGPAGFGLVIAVLSLAGVLYLLLERVVVREDQLIDRVGAVETEVAASRVALTQGMSDLNDTIAASSVAADRRNERQIRSTDRLTGWLTANCYASANGDPEARRYCEQATQRTD